MSLESFYGGKQGVSPIVQARFKYVSVEDEAYIYDSNIEGNTINTSDIMEECFKDASYEDVWYGQLAIIDTTNKRNPNNGKLFRRVLGRSEADAAKDGGTLHGEYIGRIIGASEGFPKVQLGSLSGMIDKVQESYSSINDYVFPTGNDTIFDGGSIANSSDLHYKTEGGQIAELIAKKETGQIIPGAKVDEETGELIYEQGIHYSWVNVRQNIGDENEDTYVYLGFQIPTLYLDFNFEETNWYEKFNANFENETEYKNGSQPFYQNWKIKIPRGIPGTGVGYLTRVNFGDNYKNWNQNSEEIIYDYNDITVNNTGKVILPTYSANSYPRFNVKKDSSILVYSFYIYDINESLEGTRQEQRVITCFIGPITDIIGIELNDNGSLNINYSSQDSITFENKIKWITNIESVRIGSQDEGTPLNGLKITYNYGNPDTFGPFRFIKNLQWVTNNEQTERRLKVFYTDQNNTIIPGTTEQNSNFNYVDGITIDSQTKEIKYHTNPKNAIMPQNYNEYRSFGVILDSVDDVFLDPDGHLYIKHSSSEKRYNGEPTQTEPYYPYYQRDIAVLFETEEEYKIWKRGGAFPDAIINQDEMFYPEEIRNLPEGSEKEQRKESYCRQNEWAWWLDLGLIKINQKGVIVASTFNTSRYDAYYKIQSGGNSYDWAAIKVLPKEDMESTILELLNNPWTLSEESDGTPTKYEDGDGKPHHDVSPYINGNIFIYEINDNLKMFNAKVAENCQGQFINFEGSFFYYDKVNSIWMCGGNFGSINFDLQIQLKRINGTNVPEGNVLQDGLILVESENNANEGTFFNWDSIWRVSE